MLEKKKGAWVMKKLLKVLVVCLAAVMLLSGCGLLGMLGWDREMVAFSDMEYVRPELTEYRALLEECCTLAEAGEDLDALENAILDFFAVYNSYYTNFSLADIHYCCDTSDIYWTDEYNYCMETSSEVDAGLDQLYYTLADSVFREELESEDFFGAGFFDDYEGDSLWDETFTALMEEESALVTQYYDLSAQLYGTGHLAAQEQLCTLYVQLVRLRQEIAQYAGYEDYAHFAYDFYYARDYAPEQEAEYLRDVQEELVPIYQYLAENGVEGAYYYECTEEETFEYVRGLSRSIGGVVEEAFDWMAEAELYDIAYSENKYEASFEVFLTDYYVPFVFMNPEGINYDKLTFAHEFGHFCNDFASYGTMVGIDVAEVFSQGMEYLSLIYGDAEELEKLSMYSSLCVQVEQSAYASFEQQVYALEGEELTEESVIGAFRSAMADFGLDIWGMEDLYFTTVPHFFTNPLYVFSYVVSNDAAMQIYQMELAESGAGLQVYLDNLTTEECCFLGFVESAGMESPFAEGRLSELAQTYEDALK